MKKKSQSVARSSRSSTFYSLDPKYAVDGTGAGRMPGELVPMKLGPRAAHEEERPCPFCGVRLRVSKADAPASWALHAEPLCKTFEESTLEGFVARVHGKKEPKRPRAELGDAPIASGGGLARFAHIPKSARTPA